MNKRSMALQIVCLTLMVVLNLTACASPQVVPTIDPPTPVLSTLTPVLPTPVPSMPTVLIPTATTTESLNPSPRAYTSMAYDADANQIILFGGQTGAYQLASSYNGETWAYDVAANKWTLMNPPTGPTTRCAAELAYDAESDRVILYGGADNFKWGLSDTWAYDYKMNSWKEMAKGPANHLGARLAYDAESDRIILFGGYDMGGFFINDTWAYDFNSDTWTDMKPTTSPPGRNYQALTYDSRADRVLVWGGKDVDGNKPVDESIWAYDFNTNTWQETEPDAEAHPAGRDYPFMVYNAKSDRTILVGGTPGGDETWAYDYNTNTWTRLEPKTVPGRMTRHPMVYSSAADRVILFGGQADDTKQFDYSGETWSYDFNTNTWTNVTPKP